MSLTARGVTVLALITCAFNAGAQGNAYRAPDQAAPFTMTQVAPFNLPWRIAFLPDGRMLVTEKIGALWLVTQDGAKTSVTNVPRSEYLGFNGSYLDNGGMLGVYTSPNYAIDHNIYLTYSEPGPPSGSGLALARARLSITGNTASLDGLEVIWRDGAHGFGGQVGGALAFSPDGQFLFLALGDRNRIAPPQDPDQPVGKILRLTLDGKPAPGNPQAGKIGAKAIGIIGWQRQDTESAMTARPMYTYTFPADNLTPSETWSSGHRNPLGLIFTPDGRLWELEHGPAGGDELNVIEPGKNYGWPLVSYGRHYSGAIIPHPDTRPDLAKPAVYWSPVLAPGNIALYNGEMFPEWKGSALIAGLGSRSLTRITFDGKGGAAPANRWVLGREIRDVAVGPDGTVWLLINEERGGLFRLTPKPELERSIIAQQLNWTKGGNPSANYTTVTASGTALDRTGATLTLRSSSAATSGFGTIATSIAADSFRGRNLRIIADIDARNVSGTASAWLRIDGANGMLSLNNGADSGLTGTASGHREATLFVPAEATRLTFGLLMIGSGEAGARGLRIEAQPRVPPNAPLAPQAQR